MAAAGPAVARPAAAPGRVPARIIGRELRLLGREFRDFSGLPDGREPAGAASWESSSGCSTGNCAAWNGAAPTSARPTPGAARPGGPRGRRPARAAHRGGLRTRQTAVPPTGRDAPTVPGCCSPSPGAAAPGPLGAETAEGKWGSS